MKGRVHSQPAEHPDTYSCLFYVLISVIIPSISMLNNPLIIMTAYFCSSLFCEVDSYVLAEVVVEYHSTFFIPTSQAPIQLEASKLTTHSYMSGMISTIDLSATIDICIPNKINVRRVLLQVCLQSTSKCGIDMFLIPCVNSMGLKIQLYIIIIISNGLRFANNLQSLRDIQQQLVDTTVRMYKTSIMLTMPFILLLVTLTVSQDQGDWVDPFLLPIDYTAKPFYAGYLNISSTKAYYYVYHPSESNPSKDPLMVRISAGPGCSSLYSWLYSKGPFIFMPFDDKFRHNQYNWNKQANVLFIQGPAGVGYARETNNQTINQTMDDHTFAWQNIKAIFSFYDKFPELKDQNIFLSGQQYAGITVPLMAQMIIQHNNNPLTPSWTKIRLSGMLLQNPCTLPDQCDSHFEYTPYTMQYLLNHYYISKQKYEQYRSACTLDRQSKVCQQVITDIEHVFVTTDTDINNVYKQCVKQLGPQKYKCLDMVGILNFLNSERVKLDIHAQTSINWDFCNLDILQKFHRNSEGSLPIYQKLLTEERNLRIWIVSGTMSASVPTIGTRKWMEELKYNLGLATLRMWESWMYDNNINAGEVEQIKGMTFVTVRSAGSSIYLDQPQIGYHIVNSFLKGISL